MPVLVDEFQSLSDITLCNIYDMFNATFIKQMDLFRIFKQKAIFGYLVYCNKIKSEFLQLLYICKNGHVITYLGIFVSDGSSVTGHPLFMLNLSQ